MKVYNTKYKVFGKHDSKSNFIVIGDLHGWINNEQIDKIIKDINDINPDIIFIAGDIFTTSTSWKNDAKVKDVEYLFRALTENKSRLISVLGNHDTHLIDDKLLSNYLNLDKIDNVYPLFNSSVDLDINDEIIHVAGLVTDARDGVTAATNRISKKNGVDQRPDRIVKKLEPLLDLDDKKTNILLAHDPRQLRMEKVDNSTKNFDVRLSAHIHNGYLPFNITSKDKKYLDQDCQRYLFMGIPKLNTRNFARGIAYGNGKFYVLCTQTNDYYLVKYNNEKKDNDYTEISEEDAKIIIKNNNLTPSIITGGVNRYLGLPFEGSEVTEFSIKKG